jgi:hypothetical protein
MSFYHAYRLILGSYIDNTIFVSIDQQGRCEDFAFGWGGGGGGGEIRFS